jgi:hypothetical protein
MSGWAGADAFANSRPADDAGAEPPPDLREAA